MRRLFPGSLLRQCRAPIGSRVLPPPPAVFVRAGSSKSVPLSNAKPRYDAEPDVATQRVTRTNDSLMRTTPHRVARRRKIWPVHRTRSERPLTDPDFRTEDSTEKRLPLRMETHFDNMRASGLLPGNDHQARRVYLEIMEDWRNRVRGHSSYFWDETKGRWTDESQEIFIWQRVKQRYPNLVYPKYDTPTSNIKELYLAGKAYPTLEEIDQTTLLYRYPHQDPTDRLSQLHSDMDVVDWDAVLKRIGTAQEDPQLWSKVKHTMTGYRIYLPNVQVVLRRNATPEDQPYDPMIATFRIPLSMTKTDLRSYLLACYGLEITFIRTDVRRGALTRSRDRRVVRQSGFRYNYKRAVVGLKEPFHYPDDIVELQSWGHQVGVGNLWKREAEEILEGTYGVESIKRERKEEAFRTFILHEDSTKYKSTKDVVLTPEQKLGRRVSRASRWRRRKKKMRTESLLIFRL
ncbi:hypothetical protein BD324DRAFT_637771 [Kockovaella imperatae]|uniref:Large ribosomal subunit protein uL23m n=1 Tax=Kockovaella imperatae TaxID=4999 RepID=A0A1Y1U7E3_9TREE|nr:hypothetical protein BD324DRAFT_637771 [Kockovaella imperatae]ORX33949.1 hypothetical protein BD324DRAFT_637771 [Kockovaella imperatae]